MTQRMQMHWEIYRQAEESLVIAYKTKVDLFNLQLGLQQDPGFHPIYPDHEEILCLANKILEFIYNPPTS